MKLRHQKIFKPSFESLFQKFISVPLDEEDDLVYYFADLINYYRPLKKSTVQSIQLTELLDALKAEEDKTAFLDRIITLFHGRQFKSILTDAGILYNTYFRRELKKRIIANFIPYQPEKTKLEYFLNQVFYQRQDHEWISKIDRKDVNELIELLTIPHIYSKLVPNSPLSEVVQAIRLNLQRMTGSALESGVIKMVPEYEELESPFEALEKEFDILEQKIHDNTYHTFSSEDLDLRHFKVLAAQCHQFIDTAYSNSSKYGISLDVNQNLLRIRQQLDRTEILIDFFIVQDKKEAFKKTTKLLFLLIKYNCQKNNIRTLIAESTQLISYEVTQHTAKTGEHYITKGRQEYFSMLRSATLGGIIVGFLCIFKLYIHHWELSQFGYAFFYSLNYAFGFTLIYLVGATLATKQPAMTAAAMIQSIEKDRHEKDSFKRYGAFSELASRLIRSQFIAFVGNVAGAFPVSLLLVYLIQLATSTNAAEHDWYKLVKDCSPIDSPAIFHAAIAGVFLFLSGIISGSVANSNKHNRLYYRIKEHPILKRNLGKSKTEKIASWMEKKWPGVVSNIWFGVFMGTTASVGVFLGLNLDIRHITFSAGNFAMGMFGADFELTFDMIFWAIVGIIMIGFMNFIVSFMLSLGLALRSRDIAYKELIPLFKAVVLRFRVEPMSFFFPPKKK